MAAQLLDGKAMSAELREELALRVQRLKGKGVTPGLAVILVGDDPASQIYVKNKELGCQHVSIHSVTIRLPETASQAELEAQIDKLNADASIHGILVQLPLPEHIDEQKVIYSISPLKDVDAFHPINVGKIMIGDYDFLPCTPAGVMELIDSTGTDLDGKNCVVVGRSNIVGKPMAMLLLHRNATVAICHSHTKNLKEVCAAADVLVSAVGRAHFITADMVKEGAVVIDVGMNHDENGKLCGDVEFAEVEPKASFITPVPGGVGPMTITMLMKNTLRAAELKQK